MTSNSVIYVDQAARKVVLPVNGWPARVSDMPMPNIPEDQQLLLELEGCRSAFVDDRTLFIILKDGTVYAVELVTDGKTVSKLIAARALAQTTVPSIVRKLDPDYLFVGSTVGPSILMKVAHAEEAVAYERTTSPDVNRDVEMDDDDGS